MNLKPRHLAALLLLALGALFSSGCKTLEAIGSAIPSSYPAYGYEEDYIPPPETTITRGFN